MSRRGRGRGRFQALHSEHSSEDETKDYGEFDAIKYSEECTDLYIRDSHRKHARMRKNFVEKKKRGSSSESSESFTEYGEEKEDRWQHDRYLPYSFTQL